MSRIIPGTGQKVSVNTWTGVQALTCGGMAVLLAGAAEVIQNGAARVRDGSGHGRKGKFWRRSLIWGPVAATAGALIGLQFEGDTL